jgi:hypothetical protein
MSKLKETMVKSMDKIMLNCDQATLLVTKAGVDKIGCVKNIQLRMHLMGCKFCRTFARQSELIADQLNKDKVIDSEKLKVHLSVDQKDRMQSVIETNIK